MTEPLFHIPVDLDIISDEAEVDMCVETEPEEEMELAAPIEVNGAAYNFGTGIEYDPETNTISVDQTELEYPPLQNKPRINGVELIGNKTSEELGIDRTFVFTQGTAAREWTIQHDLNKFPSVTVVDSAGTVVIGEISYVDNNTIILHFSGAFSGVAYLN